MAVQILGADGATLQKVDATSNAARVTLYATDGTVSDPVPSGMFMANIGLRHTAADAANSAVWAVNNPTGSGKSLYIRNIRGRIWFDGTAAAGASVGYHFIRYGTNVNPTTGTTVGRVRKLLAGATSVVADANIQQKSGILTLTGAVFDTSGPFNVVRMGASVTNGSQNFDIDLMTSNQGWSPLVLAPGDGMAIRTDVAAIIGLGISGSVEWDERA